MTTFRVEPRKHLRLPVTAETLSPDRLSCLSEAGVRSLPVWEGNRESDLGELFNIEIQRSDGIPVLHIVGDCRSVKGIGSRMSSGKIIVSGSMGMYLGEMMTGGRIEVHGVTGSWLGTGMKSGTIEIYGDAGDFVGGALRGQTAGMAGGEIRVHGNAGYECGCWMEDGLITIDGNVGLFAGIHMKNGELLVRGSAEGRAGASMTGGKLVIKGHMPRVLPSFTFEDVRKDTKIGSERVSGPFYAFQGDLAEGGKGRLLLSADNNPQLKTYETYLEGEL